MRCKKIYDVHFHLSLGNVHTVLAAVDGRKRGNVFSEMRNCLQIRHQLRRARARIAKE